MSISNPNTQLQWYIIGDELALLYSNATGGLTEAINQTVTDGILIHYWGEPDEVTDPDQYPDIDNVYHAPLVEHVLSKLYIEESTEQHPDRAGFYLSASREHKRNYEQKIKRLGVTKSDKTGGRRAIVPLSLR